MKKISILIIYLLINNFGYTQSKKEQILILNQRYDSLLLILNSERDNSSKLLNELNNLNSTQKSEIIDLKSDISKLNISLNQEIKNAKNKSEEILNIEYELNSLKKKINSIPNFLTIDVTNKFNDFKIKIFWIPRNRSYEYIVGPAIIEFKNNQGESHYIQNNNFALPKKGLSLEFDVDSFEVINVIEPIITRTFPNEILLDFPPSEEAYEKYFMFLLDINFDGNPELFTMGDNEAQRSGYTYKPIFYEKEGFNMRNDYHSTKCDFIFLNLDFMTQVDSTNKTIKLHHSCGAFDSFSEIYKWDGSCFKFYKKTE